jgi:hypothetical protein
VLQEPDSRANKPGNVLYQAAFDVRSERNGLLDVALNNVSENIADLHELVEKLRRQSDMETLALSMISSIGNYLTLPWRGNIYRD